MTERMRAARQRVERLIAEHPELSLDENVPAQSATNAVLYGTCDGKPIAFKVFERAYRQHQDGQMLRWLSMSGVVPKLYPYEADGILVMECLAGQMLYEVHESDPFHTLIPLYHQVGAALAKLEHFAFVPGDDPAEWQNPFTTDPFWNMTFDEFFDDVVNTSMDNLARYDLTQPELHRSIQNLLAARSEVLDQPIFMHFDDVHGANMMVEDGRLSGIFDFEMSRPGNRLYLLGAALQWSCLEDHRQWQPILHGYEEEMEEPLDSSALALLRLFAPFQTWIRFSWYWSGDEPPTWDKTGEVRPNILKQLSAVIEAVDTVLAG